MILPAPFLAPWALLAGVLLHGAWVQAQTTCQVYQYFGTDSLNAVPVLERTFDPDGRSITETFQGYRRTSMQAVEDGTVTYSYQDTLLVEELRTYANRPDSLRWVYAHDAHGRRVKESLYAYKRHRKAGEAGSGCIVPATANEDAPRWQVTVERTIAFDKEGRKAEVLQPKVWWGHEVREVWEYDRQGRPDRVKTYHDGVLFEVQEHRYARHRHTIHYDEYNRGGRQGFTGTSMMEMVELDDAGRPVLRTIEHPNSEATTTIRYRYDGDLLVRETRHEVMPGWSHARQEEPLLQETIVHEHRWNAR